jgi:RNA polymerase sigma-70 factor (ECF subfamily)
VEGLGRVMTEPRELAEPWDSQFEKFYLEHYGRVVGVLFRLTANRGDAEELANEVFVKLYRRQSLPSPGGNVAGWLHRTATNLGIDGLRKDSRRRRHENAAAHEAREAHLADGPLAAVLSGERRRRVREALAQLKPVQAQALILRASGFSYQEVADALDVKRVSVGTLLLRAEEAFRKTYRAIAGEEEES